MTQLRNVFFSVMNADQAAVWVLLAISPSQQLHLVAWCSVCDEM